VFDKNYTHTQINSLFLSASAPETIPSGNKSDKVTTWLRAINNEAAAPLDVLGILLVDLMDKEEYGVNQSYIENLHADRKAIRECLSKDGLSYNRGGFIVKSESFPTISLRENVAKRGLFAVEIEIKRCLENAERDPSAAAHNAASVLEASLKAYLEHYRVPYKEESDTLSELWRIFVSHIGIIPKEFDDKDLKKIASGLFNIIDGTMHLRNKKSAAHGRSGEQFRTSIIRPRHARLAIHAAHTVSAYVLEFLDAPHL
jgi:hypothetical protein